MVVLRQRFGRLRLAGLAAGLLCILPMAVPAVAQVSSFVQSVAGAAQPDPAVAAFYRDRIYATLWTGPGDAQRRAALLAALADAPAHGLPATRYDAHALTAAFRNAVTEGDRGRLEVAMTAAFLAYARDLQTGVLEPAEVDGGILRQVARREPAALLAAFLASDPQTFLRSLPPRAVEYAQLMAEKLRLEAQMRSSGWGPALAEGALKPGARGADVVALRDRLMALGYLGRSAAETYDRQIEAAVQRFQLDQGLNADGVAGASTVAALNVAPAARWQSVVVAMERLRWLGDAPRGARHIWVNQPDFTAQIIDNGRVTFRTRAVIGKNVADQRSPEFSDEMEYMVVNPSWGVPRSITVKEYLPLLQRNPEAVAHLQVVDRRGRVVPRGAVDFAAYSARTFPFALRQPPSDGNALGKVKFMFPNPQNIYLHDTPTKSLFAQEERAYSHGCIRLADPMDFAFALLAAQSPDPRGDFTRALESDRETNLSLVAHVPVHLVYFTAWPSAEGTVSYRRDVYGRDARIFEALVAAGVVQAEVQG